MSVSLSRSKARSLIQRAGQLADELQRNLKRALRKAEADGSGHARLPDSQVRDKPYGSHIR